MCTTLQNSGGNVGGAVSKVERGVLLHEHEIALPFPMVFVSFCSLVKREKKKLIGIAPCSSPLPHPALPPRACPGIRWCCGDLIHTLTFHVCSQPRPGSSWSHLGWGEGLLWSYLTSPGLSGRGSLGHGSEVVESVWFGSGESMETPPYTLAKQEWRQLEQPRVLGLGLCWFSWGRLCWAVPWEAGNGHRMQSSGWAVPHSA